MLLTTPGEVVDDWAWAELVKCGRLGVLGPLGSLVLRVPPRVLRWRARSTGVSTRVTLFCCKGGSPVASAAGS